jgi:hypothetical protein
VPVKVGVATFVTSSEFDVPVSLPASRSGVDGASGAVTSIVTASAPLAADGLPAESSAVAVIE